MSPLEGPPSLAPAACAPWTGSSLPVEAQACEVREEYKRVPYPDAVTSQRRRYDAQGHLLELRSFAQDGRLLLLETHTWAGGLETLRRSETSPEHWHEQAWTYTSQRQVEQFTEKDWTATDSPVMYHFSYSPQGRLERIDRHVAGQPAGQSVYVYDMQGRLTSITSEPRCKSFTSPCEEFTYFPDGRYRRQYWEGNWDGYIEDYDSAGRLVERQYTSYELFGSWLFQYDASGRLIRTWANTGRDTIVNALTVTTSVYDTQGRLLLQRVGEDKHTAPPVGDVEPYDEHSRITRRLTYLCGTQLPWLEEWDSNEDGVPDGRRTYERDTSGRLLREEYSGTSKLDVGVLLRDYSYDCP